MTGERILIVEDDERIGVSLARALDSAGYQTTRVVTGADAVASAVAEAADLVLLDLGLPDLDGKAVIGQIRQTSPLPIIVLSARDAEAEKIDALDLGANDFVEKPFGIGELLARVRASLRGSGGAPAHGKLELGPLEIDIDAHMVRVNGQAVHLTPKEFQLLALLAQNAGRVLTHRQLLLAVWGPAHTEDVAYLRVMIGQLRQKIEADPGDPRLILTETGIGYRAAAASR